MQTNFEILKKEFTKALNSELNKKKAKHTKASNFKEMADNFGQAKDIGEEIVDILNNVLDKRSIDFEGDEKDEFQEYIQPTIGEYYKKFLDETI